MLEVFVVNIEYRQTKSFLQEKEHLFVIGFLSRFTVVRNFISSPVFRISEDRIIPID